MWSSILKGARGFPTLSTAMFAFYLFKSPFFDFFEHVKDGYFDSVHV
jgi:hypothetical protein